MKRILACVIIILVSMSIIFGCLPGVGSPANQFSTKNSENWAESPWNQSLHEYIAESIPSYGYAFLHMEEKGGVIC